MILGASSVPSAPWQVVMPQRGVQQGQDWSTVSFSNRPQSAASSSHQKQQGLKDAQRTGGQIETSTKFGGGKNGGLTAAAAEAHRLDNDTGEGSRAPLPPPHWRKPPSPIRICAPLPRSATGGGWGCAIAPDPLHACARAVAAAALVTSAPLFVCALTPARMPGQMRRCLQS